MVETKVKRKPGRPRKGEGVQDKIIKLQQKGITDQSVIAAAAGCDPSTVHYTLEKYGTNATEIKRFEENKPDLIRAVQGKLIRAMVTKDLNDTPMQQLATSFGILVDKERLISGQSTSNFAMVIKKIGDLDRMDDSL